MEKLELHCYTDGNGVFHIQNRARLTEWGKMNPNKQLLMRVDKRGSRRSTQQNRYYFGVVVAEVRLGFIELGHEMTAEQTHDWLKEKFNPIAVENKKGVVVDMPGTTTQMTKTQFGEYIEKIARFAAEYLSIRIPSPNESLEMKFE